MRLFKYLAQHKTALLVVMVLLLGQAVCDLALPNLTSNIVDVGIQQSGIEHVAVEEMRAQTYDAIKDALPTDERQKFQSYYEQTPQGTYAINAAGRKDIKQLDAMLLQPMISVNMGSVVGQIPDQMLNQQGIAAALKEYNQLGYDLPGMQMRYLVLTGALMLAITALSMVFAIITGFVAARTGAKIGRNLRRNLFEKVVRFSDAEIGKFSAASLITRGTNDIQMIQMVCTMMMRLALYSPILAIGGIAMVLYTNAEMGWIIVVAVAVVLAAIAVLFAVAIPKFKIMQKLIDRVNLIAREILNGMPVIRAFQREAYEQARFDVANIELMKTQLFTNRVMTFMMPLMMLIINITSVAIIWFGGFYIDNGVIQTGEMIAFITYAMVIIMGFLMIGMMSIMLPRADVAAERIDEVLETKPSIVDSPDAQTLDYAEVSSPASGIALDTCADASTGVHIKFSNVSFSYDADSENVLEDINFEVKPGETMAIIGSTGSGKSTVLKLIERFYDVNKGSVEVNGIDVRNLKQSNLRGLFGYVPQKAFLFSGTIDSNIAYSDEGMLEAQVKEAYTIAQAAEFVASKESGVLSPIAQGGTNISGGQRQRLCIARALAKKPPAFLFDDSFSALDYKTDARLRGALKANMANATCIIVAQRIATVLEADHILVLDEGKVVGHGTHQELLQHCTEYREIALSQLSEEELGFSGDAA